MLKQWMVLGFMFLALAANAQSSKKIVEKRIVKRTVTEVYYEDGLDSEVIEEEKWFNEKGQLEQLKEYNKEGKLKNWVKYTYTADGEIETETYFTHKAKVSEKIVYVYEDDLKTEKQYYDSKNRLVKKKVYAYDHQ